MSVVFESVEHTAKPSVSPLETLWVINGNMNYSILHLKNNWKGEWHANETMSKENQSAHPSLVSQVPTAVPVPMRLFQYRIHSSKGAGTFHYRVGQSVCGGFGDRIKRHVSVNPEIISSSGKYSMTVTIPWYEHFEQLSHIYHHIYWNYWIKKKQVMWLKQTERRIKKHFKGHLERKKNTLIHPISVMRAWTLWSMNHSEPYEVWIVQYNLTKYGSYSINFMKNES